MGCSHSRPTNDDDFLRVANVPAVQHQTRIIAATFEQTYSIPSGDIVSMIRNDVIGSATMIVTPFGQRRLVYADYTASGRCLGFIESYLRSVVYPLYANTHTEASAAADTARP